MTCDLDLGADILPLLPEECQNLDPEASSLYLREAESFKIFHQKLIAYEESLETNPDDAAKDWDFREELYESVQLNLCRNDTKSKEDFLNCYIDKRNEMIKLLDDKIAARSGQ